MLALALGLGGGGSTFKPTACCALGELLPTPSLEVTQGPRSGPK